MKRTNVYLEQSQMDRIARLAADENVAAAEVMRRMIDLGLMLHDPNDITADIEFVRQKMIEKNGGADVSYSREFLLLAQEKAEEYRSRQHNSARLTTVVEHLDELIAVNRDLAQKNQELIDLIRGGKQNEPSI